MDNLCINLKDKTVKYEINEQQEPILMFYSGKSTTYVLNVETLDKFNDIISNRSNEATDVTRSIQTLLTESKHTKTELFEFKTESIEIKTELIDIKTELIEFKTELIELNIKFDRQNEKFDRQNEELKQMIQKMFSKNQE